MVSYLLVSIIDMKTPFQFGKVVEGRSFTNRTKEIQRLEANFENNIHTILISPRRWGKSSLVHRAAKNSLKNHSDIRVCFLDLFKIRNEEDFYAEFAKQAIRATSNKVDEWVATAKLFLKRVTPRFSFGIDPINDFEMNFDVKELLDSYEEILNLPEQIAKSKKISIIICIDEFQNLANFKEPDLFQKRLRAVIQHHQSVTYCLFGSKRHMLTEIFENPSMPFYRFGDVLYLEKIAKTELVNFIVNGFNQTGKKISPELAEKVADSMRCHPYYVQQFSYIVWINTQTEVTEKIMEESIEELLQQNDLFFLKEVDNLSTTQVNFLKAVAKGVQGLSSASVLQQYQLGTSANVNKIKESLEKKEIIDTYGAQVEFLDPAFEKWFIKHFNNSNGISAIHR